MNSPQEVFSSYAQDVEMDFLDDLYEGERELDAHNVYIEELYGQTIEEIQKCEQKCSLMTAEELEKVRDVPASPIRVEWPSDSLLKEDHFTIDKQRCLVCHTDLGYAMPMNRVPKVKYLFCEKDNCQKTQFIECFSCGQYHGESTGRLVFRPGNSAYTGPTQIYSFMCTRCYTEQIENEPGVAETQEMMAKVREERKKYEEMEAFHRDEIYQRHQQNPNSVGVAKTVHYRERRSTPSKKRKAVEPTEVVRPKSEGEYAFTGYD